MRPSRGSGIFHARDDKCLSVAWERDAATVKLVAAQAVDCTNSARVICKASWPGAGGRPGPGGNNPMLSWAGGAYGSHWHERPQPDGFVSDVGVGGGEGAPAGAPWGDRPPGPAPATAAPAANSGSGSVISRFIPGAHFASPCCFLDVRPAPSACAHPVPRQAEALIFTPFPGLLHTRLHVTGGARPRANNCCLLLPLWMRRCAPAQHGFGQPLSRPLKLRVQQLRVARDRRRTTQPGGFRGGGGLAVGVFLECFSRRFDPHVAAGPELCACTESMPLGVHPCLHKTQLTNPVHLSFIAMQLHAMDALMRDPGSVRPRSARNRTSDGTEPDGDGTDGAGFGDTSNEEFADQDQDDAYPDEGGMAPIEENSDSPPRPPRPPRALHDGPGPTTSLPNVTIKSQLSGIAWRPLLAWSAVSTELPNAYELIAALALQYSHPEGYVVVGDGDGDSDDLGYFGSPPEGGPQRRRSLAQTNVTRMFLGSPVVLGSLDGTYLSRNNTWDATAPPAEETGIAGIGRYLSENAGWRSLQLDLAGGEVITGVAGCRGGLLEQLVVYTSRGRVWAPETGAGFSCSVPWSLTAPPGGYLVAMQVGARGSEPGHDVPALVTVSISMLHC